MVEDGGEVFRREDVWVVGIQIRGSEDEGIGRGSFGDDVALATICGGGIGGATTWLVGGRGGGVAVGCAAGGGRNLGVNAGR